MKYLSVDGDLNLLRDTVSNAIINTNTLEYNAYIEQRELKKNEVERVDKIENEIIGLKDDLNEIKNLLRSMIK